MPITVGGSCVGYGSGNGSAISLTAGSVVFVLVGMTQDSSQTYTVADTAGHTYNQIDYQGVYWGGASASFWAKNPSTTGNVTVTVTGSSGGYIRWIAIEFKGADLTKNAPTAHGSAQGFTSPSFGVTGATDVIVLGTVNGGDTTPTVGSTPAGMTLAQTLHDYPGYPQVPCLGLEYKILSSAYSGTMNMGSDPGLSTCFHASFAAVLPVAATPTFSPVAGSSANTITVTISSTTPGMTFRYTTDGSTPTSSYGTVGTSVSVSTNCTVKAICYGSGYQDSAVGSAAYTINVATPSFDKGAGTYSGNQTVTISCATAGVTIRYTTDGSTPASAGNGTVGTSASITGNCTLKAIAYRAGATDSGLESAAYTILKGRVQGGNTG